MNNNYMDYFNQFIKNNDWQSFADIIDFSMPIEDIVNKFNEKELESIAFGLSKHMDLLLKECSEGIKNINYNKRNIQFEKTKLIEMTFINFLNDYIFIGNIANLLKNDKIYSSFAYINYNLFINGNNIINKIIKKNNNCQINSKLLFEIKNNFNNAKNCYLAVDIYNSLLNKNKIDLKNLYRYAKVLMKIDNFSINLEIQKKIFSRTDLKWVINYSQRISTVKNLFKTVIQIYENELIEKAEKDRFYSEYIKSKYNLVKCINDYYQSNFKVNELFKSIAVENKKYKLNFISKDLISDIKEMNNDIIFLLNEFQLPEKELNKEEIERIANLELPEKSYDIYYRAGKVRVLLAKLAVSDIFYLKDRTIEEAIKKFVENIEMAMYMYINVFNIKWQRIKMNKNDSGGFTYELEELAFCYSILGIDNKKYVKEINNLIDKYQNKKKYARFIDTANFYYALTLIYNKNTKNVTKAIEILSKLKDSKNKYLVKKVESILSDIR